jgi:hypothetical protein
VLKVKCLGVPDEVEEVDVAAGELLGAVDAEGVVPDDPTAAVEGDVVLGGQLQFRGVFVADGQPKRPVRLQDPVNGLHPAAAPVDVGFVVLLVVVGVVFVADVERRIGEDQIDRAGLHRGQAFQAIAVIHLSQRDFHAPFSS